MDLFNPSIAFGLTPFETIYFQNKEPERLEKHYKRLLRASMVLNVLYEDSFEEFEESVRGFINNSNENNGVLKAINLNGKLQFKIRKPSYTKEGFEKGISLCISKLKKDPRSILTYFKTLNYGENVLEDTRAKKRGFDGCIFTNNNDDICETSYANIFFRKEDTLYTPEIRCGILPGIMRDDIIKFAYENGFVVKKARIKLNEINEMDECFISNTVSAVYPVKNIGNTSFTSRDFVITITKNKKFNRPWN
ncbi:MAG: aminotransferase class IV [Clostridium sp.]